MHIAAVPFQLSGHSVKRTLIKISTNKHKGKKFSGMDKSAYCTALHQKELPQLNTVTAPIFIGSFSLVGNYRADIVIFQLFPAFKIGKLNKVLLHRPGKELEALSTVGIYAAQAGLLREE